MKSMEPKVEVPRLFSKESQRSMSGQEQRVGFTSLFREDKGNKQLIKRTIKGKVKELGANGSDNL